MRSPAQYRDSARPPPGMDWISVTQAFATTPFCWQRRIVALLQPLDACRFAACCRGLFRQKGYIAEVHKAEHPHRCDICGNVPCHPHRLPDCGHVACGRCIYSNTFPHRFSEFHGWRCQHPSDDWKKSCGMAVRRRPEKLGAGHRSHEDLMQLLLPRCPQHALP